MMNAGMLTLMIELGTTPSLIGPTFGFWLVVSILVIGIGTAVYLFIRKTPNDLAHDKANRDREARVQARLAEIDRQEEQSRLLTFAQTGELPPSDRMDMLTSGADTPKSHDDSFLGAIYTLAHQYGFHVAVDRQHDVLILKDTDLSPFDIDKQEYRVELSKVRSKRPRKVLGDARSAVNKRAKRQGLNVIQRKRGPKKAA